MTGSTIAVRRASRSGYPRWHRDGGEVFYLSSDSRLMAAAVTVEGTRLVAGDAQSQAAPFTLVVNWPAAVRT